MTQDRTSHASSLIQSIARVRGYLEQHVSGLDREVALTDGPAAVDLDQTPPSPLSLLCESFGLSGFERDILVLTAGFELDGSFAELCSAAQSDPTVRYPTFALALAALPDASWNAIAPGASLRQWHLISVDLTDALVSGRLTIDETILHYLLDGHYHDEQLTRLIEAGPVLEPLTPNHASLVERMTAAWASADTTLRPPVLQLCGPSRADKLAIAAHACAAMQLLPNLIVAEALPTSPIGLEEFMRQWDRAAALGGNALLLDCSALDISDVTRDSAVGRVIERCSGACVVIGRDRRHQRQRTLLTYDVENPTALEQRDLWRTALKVESGSSPKVIDELVATFRLSASAIRAAHAGAVETLASQSAPQPSDETLGEALWDSCRNQARPALDSLARRLESTATWTDLVLPPLQREQLREIAVRMRHQSRLYQEWGFEQHSSRGLGMNALFAGASGTGKTLASEVLATELGLDLYIIDLSSVVNKYVGETEKNLSRIFDAAEDGGAILLFAECDALFGNRSGVKDSHDRYANIEASYLLQRIESYNGLVIFATNMSDGLDPAFLRRLRIVVNFPDPTERERPDRTGTDSGSLQERRDRY